MIQSVHYSAGSGLMGYYSAASHYDDVMAPLKVLNTILESLKLVQKDKKS